MISYFRTRRSIYIGKITLDSFMLYNPPCKECLVQNMCLFAYGNSNPPPPCQDVKSWNLRAKPCNILYEFLINNKAFGMPEFKNH